MAEPSSYAPIHTNRIFTGLWTNRSPLRDAATSEYLERSGMGRQDSILGGQNSEISTRLTLRRRFGNSVWSAAAFITPRRFYSFNTFTLTDEVIHVMVDEPGAVYDSQQGQAKDLIWTKTQPNPTYFLGVGNTLYFTNGVDNKLWIPGSGVFNWGIPAPATKPSVTQQPRPNPYLGRNPSTGYATWILVNPAGGGTYYNAIVIKGSDGNLQQWPGNPFSSDPPTVQTQTLGLNEPTWSAIGQSTIDGTVSWLNKGPCAWVSGFGYGLGDIVVGTRAGYPDQLFVCVRTGQSNTSGVAPLWPQTVKQQISDGNSGLIWESAGPLKGWGDFGVYQSAQAVSNASLSVDANGNLQAIFQMGKSSSSTTVAWGTEVGSLTTDNTAVWVMKGNYAQRATGALRYGYAYVKEVNGNPVDGSNMSPPSDPITVILGNEVVVQGVGTADAQVTTIYIYRLAQDGATYLYRAEVPNPGAGVTWTFTDTDITASALNPLIQAQVRGEGTPLPAGATCLGYHLGRIFAAVGNVVYVSSGGDAIIGGFSGNQGFNTTFTAQSKITRFWTCSLGMVVFTVRDAYIILGSATDNDPLYMVVFIEQIPLLNYDAFTVNKTTPFMLMGNKMLIALDPSAGITEIGFPIADRLRDEFDPKTAYVTYHSESSDETALYVGNANGQWYRMNQNNSPEQGSAWSTKALVANCGALQSVEVTPGVFRLLWGAVTGSQPIMKRDITRFTDNGTPYAVNTRMGSIVLALPGQLAELAFITLESLRVGTRAGLALLLGEIFETPNSPFEPLDRTRQDPPNLPPSETLFSDRYHFQQNQKTAWCRHFQMEVSWPAEDAASELLTFTIFGQTWQEMRSQ